MFNNIYNSDDNGSGFEDEVFFGEEKKYHAMNPIKDEEIKDAFRDATGADESGFGEEDDNTYDDAE